MSCSEVLIYETENWKSINSFIEISNLGNVKSHGNLIKGEIINSGYRRIHVSHNGKDYKLSVHRLVAEAFMPNPLNKPQVNHKDGNKLNNNVSNLEWCTSSENMVHAYKTKLRSCNGELNTQSKLTEIDVVNIRNMYVKGSKEFNTYKLAERYGVTPKTIEKVVKRKTWGHI